MRPVVFLVAVASAWVVVAPLQAQKATEMWIPIGQSPGVSGTMSAVGTIATCEPASGALQMATDKGPQAATLTTATKIWIDRSATKRANSVGDLADCQKGRRAEVKYVYDGAARTARAEWIKIAAP